MSLESWCCCEFEEMLAVVPLNLNMAIDQINLCYYTRVIGQKNENSCKIPSNNK